MKTTKHWLHILLTILTSGLWLPIYVILLATTEMYNRGYRVGKAAGRVEKSNEFEAERLDINKVQFSISKPCTFVDGQGRRVIVGADGDVRFGCTMAPVVPFEASGEFTVPVPFDDLPKTYSAVGAGGAKVQSRTFERFKELGDRMLSGQPLDSYEQLEYNELRAKVIG